MSMGQLIAMRTLQGLGAGAVGPIVLTMLGRPLHLAGASTRARTLQRGLGTFQRGRSDHRGLFDRIPELRLAMGFPGQRAVRDHRDRDAGLVREGTRRESKGRTDRLGRSRPVDGRPGQPPARRAGWISARGHGLRGDPRGVDRVAHPVRVPRTPGRRSDTADGPDDAADDRGFAGRELPDRRDPLRHRDVHPAVRPGGSRGRRAAGRPDADAVVPGLGDQRGGGGARRWSIAGSASAP